MGVRDFAVILGIDFYPGLTDLNGAKNDAAWFEEWVRSPECANVPDENIFVRMSRLPKPTNILTAEPSLTIVDSAFREVRHALTDPQDRGGRLYVFAAGHGFAPSSDEACLITAEATREELQYHIAARAYARWFVDAAYFSEVFLVCDCCRGFVKPRTPAGLLWEPEREKQTPAARTAYWFAAPWGSETTEDFYPERGQTHGFFSRAVMIGLSGAAADSTGLITTDRLRHFVEWYFQQVTTADPPRFDSSDNFHICTINPPTSTVEIEAPHWPVLHLVDHTLAEISLDFEYPDTWRGVITPGLFAIEETDGRHRVQTFEQPGSTSLRIVFEPA
jgi:hypothetical protein